MIQYQFIHIKKNDLHSPEDLHVLAVKPVGRINKFIIPYIISQCYSSIGRRVKILTITLR